MSRRKVKAFECVECERLPCGADEDGCCTTCGLVCSVVHLVEADPLRAKKEAVLRAAMKWAHLNRNNEGSLSKALNRTIAALQKSQAKRSKR